MAIDTQLVFQHNMRIAFGLEISCYAQQTLVRVSRHGTQLYVRSMRMTCVAVLCCAMRCGAVLCCAYLGGAPGHCEEHLQRNAQLLCTMDVAVSWRVGYDSLHALSHPEMHATTHLQLQPTNPSAHTRRTAEVRQECSHVCLHSTRVSWVRLARCSERHCCCVNKQQN